eukprot:TRINITY_DN14478_c0_g1_i1.p1 TRINITY_DN14478_c0_g1~~TRINITY_DN14478_c0_g1_i1.p1  ORF type:complete len:132 (-),score=11.00 TRINITY_DN14478_c0_g1_i1:86-481(-)
MNRVDVEWVHADAFDYARQASKQGAQFSIVACDPSKFVSSRDPSARAAGLRKYEDLNKLAVGLVRRGGLYVTCSCSGMLSMSEFEDIVSRAAHSAGRRLQFIDRTGAPPDHPTMSNTPEAKYLKVLWSKVI